METSNIQTTRGSGVFGGGYIAPLRVTDLSLLDTYYGIASLLVT